MLAKLIRRLKNSIGRVDNNFHYFSISNFERVVLGWMDRWLAGWLVAWLEYRSVLADLGGG